MKRFLLSAFALLLISGCSNEQMYNSLLGAKESECQKIADTNERNHCLDAAQQPYGKYEQQRQESLNN